MTVRVLADLLARHQPGFSLPRAFYTDEDVFRLDLERIFRRCWLFAGFACQAATPGDYFTFAVGDDSLIILRGDDGRLNSRKIGFEAARRLDQLMTGQLTAANAPALVIPPLHVVTRRSTDILAIEDALVAQALAFINRRVFDPIGV
jgi:hypothetical protein